MKALPEPFLFVGNPKNNLEKSRSGLAEERLIINLRGSRKSLQFMDLPRIPTLSGFPGGPLRGFERGPNIDPQMAPGPIDRGSPGAWDPSDRDAPERKNAHLRNTIETPMWETCSVQLNVRLPREIAQQAEEVQETDPEFLSRVVLYGLTRRSVYRHLRDQQDGTPESPDPSVSLPL